MSKIKIFGLGGLDENGKNTYVVDIDNKLFILDAGLKYANDSHFGIDYPQTFIHKYNRHRCRGVIVSGKNEFAAIIDKFIKPSEEFHI